MTDRCTRCGAEGAEYCDPATDPAVLCERCARREDLPAYCAIGVFVVVFLVVLGLRIFLP